MRKTVFFLITIFSIFSFSVCTHAYNIKETADHFADFSPEITVVSNDPDKVMADIFDYDPRLVMYYKGYNSSYNSLMSVIKPVYTNKDVPLSEIYTADNSTELTDLITRAMLYTRPRLCVVCQNMPSSGTDINGLISSISESCPVAYMGYKGHQTTSIDSKSGKYSCYVIKFDYDYDAATLLNIKKTTEQKVAEIMSANVPEDMPAYQKEYLIHDYVVKNCQYATDYEANSNPDYYNAYGALVNGKAVCNGYAFAVKLMLDFCGIENHIITGTSKGIGHAWNLVKLDNEYYHLDTTWDDPVGNADANYYTHEYYNLTDSQISSDHIWEKQKFPAANGSAYSLANTENLMKNDSNEYKSRFKTYTSAFRKFPELGSSENPKETETITEINSTTAANTEKNSADKYTLKEVLSKITEHVTAHPVFYVTVLFVLILIFVIFRKRKKR